jgi:hypothetical protein
MFDRSMRLVIGGEVSGLMERWDDGDGEWRAGWVESENK